MSDNKKPLEQRSFESVSKAIEARKQGKPSVFNKLLKDGFHHQILRIG